MEKTTIKPEQSIDAVAMVRAIRDAQATQIEGMTPDQKIAFYRAKAQELLLTLQKRQLADHLAPL